ncbi:signal peptidase I [candidate division WWE3 bacterium]|uniref:Signal peptidase I n=1 Tax=candidate division WWE3 bacterium TaxID=2053526 RepID=A0A7X9E6Y8_UNCKA|nr:signal peptidase I [candidate division WWE3 bacterium]
MKVKELIVEIIESLVVSFIVIMLIYMLVASVEVVVGPSMEPNFYSGERILVDRITKKLFPLKRGEIVVFFPPNDNESHYIKRIVGMPGDIFKIIDCGVVISKDGERFKLDESYLGEGTCTEGNIKIREGHSIRIEDNQYALLGDNREESLDSRILGFVDKKRIIGRVVFRFWPLNKVGFVN